MKPVQLFTDGSALGNPGPGGWCAILRYGDRERTLQGAEIHTTNNRMELLAVIEGLKVLKEPCEVALYSDSTYVVRGINEWLQNWKKRHYAKVKNPDLWQAYDTQSQPHHIQAHWVRGHDGHEENERCDAIARTQAEEIRRMG